MSPAHLIYWENCSFFFLFFSFFFVFFFLRTQKKKKKKISTEKYNIPKRQGDKNFTTWSIRLKALLTKEDLSKPLEEPVIGVKNDKALSYIKLLCEDGPLLYIATIESAYKAWERLKELYDPKGFTTEWITLREFFNTSLEHFDSMEEYLFRVKALLDNL